MNVPFFDTFSNFLSGLGVPGRDKLTAFRYTRQIWTRDQLEASFQTDWIARKAIVIPAEDSTREWRAWQAEADQIELLEEVENKLQLQLKLQQALIKARLYGGCCILIGVDGNMAEELDTNTIKKDGLKFIHILAPHQLKIEELNRDISSPYYGQPLFYELTDQEGKYGTVRIHPSRMVRLTGLDAPDPLDNYGWGDPALQVIHDAVAGAGTVAQSIAVLIAEAKFDVVKIPGLTEIFSTTAGTGRLIKRFSEANVAKSVINAVVLDAEEEWERIGVNFEGMPEILQMYLQIAAGAADIPSTRFLGRSPSGLNATGDSDLQNYYDRIASDQELRLSPALEKLDEAIIRSALGKDDEDVWYEWRSLWQMSDAEKAEIANKKATTAKLDADTGLVPLEALVLGRCNQLVEDGTYPGLEQAIEDAIANEEMLQEQALAIEEAQALEAESAASFGGGAANQNAEPTQKKAVGDKGWDESLHPRDPGGEGGGQWVSGGGSDEGSNYLPESAAFVSPSVKSGMDVKGAAKELDSGQQKRLRLAGADIDKKVRITRAQTTDVIGAWKDDGSASGAYAENSIMTSSDSDWDRMVLSAVMKGHLADQKAVIVFQQQKGGKAVMSHFEATGSLSQISRTMLNNKIDNYTLVPKEGGATVYVVDIKGTEATKVRDAARKYGKENWVHYQTGKAQLIGDTEEDVGDEAWSGTDREQRDRAKLVYEAVIDRSPIPRATAVWEDVRNYWGTPTGKQGFDLTSAALAAEFPNVKKNSVVKTEVAKTINERANKILERDLGVARITEENHTEATDEYLAGVIEMELREALIAGGGGEHWYDDTIKQAMTVAEEIYPGVKDDPNQRFLYTVALATTSQGETVESNVRLADMAYSHYREHGVFPIDFKVKKPSILENLRKVNEAIDAYGGGETGIAKLREFFNKQMTARELAEKTGVEPGMTLKDDTVYGSAMLGPKIGNGFFQNLNGNFNPITMDLWFMRGWGRITGSGVSDQGFGKQMTTFREAMAKENRPVPTNEDEAIKLAEEVNDQHESDYVKFRKDFDEGKREKGPAAHAAERLMIAYKGAMIEAPKNGNQRKWITAVFRRALDKLKEDHGLNLTPAGAQATWWWPEKATWEGMGLTGKKRDADYLKELTALRDKKRGPQS